MSTAGDSSDTGSSTVEYDYEVSDTMSDGETAAADAPVLAPMDNPPTTGGAEATSSGDATATTATCTVLPATVMHHVAMGWRPATAT